MGLVDLVFNLTEKNILSAGQIFREQLVGKIKEAITIKEEMNLY